MGGLYEPPKVPVLSSQLQQRVNETVVIRRRFSQTYLVAYAWEFVRAVVAVKKATSQFRTGGSGIIDEQQQLVINFGNPRDGGLRSAFDFGDEPFSTAESSQIGVRDFHFVVFVSKVLLSPPDFQESAKESGSA